MFESRNRTDIDGKDRVALCAVVLENGQYRGIGLSRDSTGGNPNAREEVHHRGQPRPGGPASHPL